MKALKGDPSLLQDGKSLMQGAAIIGIIIVMLPGTEAAAHL
ncbi:MAG TPA: hypothetical protein VHP30_08730 [Ignavibacteriales bacterium]|nr:hypothetical protein [Ignavibacteriales bacterium]